MFRRIVMFIVCLFSLQGVQLQAQPVNVTIDADEVQWTISKYLLGMHLVYPHERDAIYADGRICISILHPPGDDPMQYEDRSERWTPVQSIEKILISVTSMLAEPNYESPANVEAAVRERAIVSCCSCILSLSLCAFCLRSNVCA